MSEETEDGDFDMVAANGGAAEAEEEEEGRVLEWETGLPSADELVPLSQPLVPPELAVAFRIPPEPAQTLLDVDRSSRQTLDNIRRIPSSSSPSSLRSFHPSPSLPAIPAAADDDDEGPAAADSSRKTRRIEGSASAAAAAAAEEGDSSAALLPESSSGAQKRPRLVWTPQLHKRFVDVVAHLGIKNAVPKTIMQLMNVEGLTRENVASHLQKYRLYLKRMQGLSDEGPSPSDPLFASAPVPPNLREQPYPAPVPVPVPMQVPYVVVPVPAFGMTHPYGHGGPMGIGMGMGMVPISNHQVAAATNGFGPIVTYPHVTPNDK